MVNTYMPSCVIFQRWQYFQAYFAPLELDFFVQRNFLQIFRDTVALGKAAEQRHICS